MYNEKRFVFSQSITKNRKPLPGEIIRRHLDARGTIISGFLRECKLLSHHSLYQAVSHYPSAFSF